MAETADEREEQPDERRAAPRMRVLKRAKVVFNHGYSTIDAIVRNISATGALLTVDDAVNLPKQFELRLGEEAARPAKLVYRRSMFAGIRFLDVDGDGVVPAARPGPDRSLERSPAAPAAAPATAMPEGGSADAPETASIGEPPAERPSKPGHIRRVMPEDLPETLTGRFPWSAAGR